MSVKYLEKGERISVSKCKNSLSTFGYKHLHMDMGV